MVGVTDPSIAWPPEVAIERHSRTIPPAVDPLLDYTSLSRWGWYR